MKQFKQFCAAILLTLVLSLSVFAGDILSPAATDPLASGDVDSSSVTISAPRETGTPDTTSTTNFMTVFTVELCAQLLSIC